MKKSGLQETLSASIISKKQGAAFGLTISDLFQKVGISIDDAAKLALTLF